MAIRKDFIASGELYFIKEKDALSKEYSDYVKIGLVKQSESKSSEDRMREHQTGNPRPLVLFHVVESPAIFQIENMMHRTFAPQRVSGEWFLLSEAQLTSAVQAAEDLASELRAVEPKFVGLEDLNSVISEGESIEPSQELLSWFHRWERAELVIKKTKELKERIVTMTKDANARGEDLTDHARVLEVSRSVLNKNELQTSYPDIYKHYLISTEKVAGRFIFDRSGLDHLDLASEWPEFASFLSSANSVLAQATEGAATLAEISRISFRLMPFDARAELDQILAEGVLKRACGTAPGINSICKWTRALSTVEKFDEKQFVAENPELAARLTTSTMVTRVVKNTGNRDFDDDNVDADIRESD